MAFENFEKIQNRFDSYWAMQNSESPLISIFSLKNNHNILETKKPSTIYEQWTDIEYIIEKTRNADDRTFFGGDAFPNIFPNLGPDILSACLGCNIEFAPDTVWAKHELESLEGVSFKFDPANKWYKKIVDMTKALVDNAKGDYFVGITDLHAGLDSLVSFRGAENLCYDLIEYPDEVKRLTFEIWDAFKIIFENLHDITQKNLPGYTSWMNSWCREKWYITSCDFMCMISPDMYDEFIEDELKTELDYFDKSIFHLDGPGAIKHLDKLLEYDRMTGIQWVYGHDRHAARYWIDLLQKIQKAGKTIQISSSAEDVPLLLEALRPEGLHIITCCENENTARDLEKMTQNYFVKKLF